MKAFVILTALLSAMLAAGEIYAQEAPVPETNENAPAQISDDAASVIDTQPALVAGNVTVNFKNADIKAVLNYLADVGGVDIVPAPDVTGQITMKLTNKPWQVALDILVRNCGYVIVKEGDVVRVVKKESLEGEEQVTEVISLNYIVPNRYLSGISSEEGISGTSGINSTEDSMALPELIAAIKAVLKTGETVTFLPPANALIITAIPARISAIKAMVAKIDVAPEQIMLEAKIIEISLDKNEKMGIDWTAQITMAGAKRPTTLPFDQSGNIRSLGAQFLDYLPKGANTATTKALNFPTNSEDGVTSFPTADAMGTLTSNFAYGTLDFTAFQAVMQYINKRENARMLATPRITTLNNKEAYIRVTDNVYLEKITSSTTTENYVVGTEFEQDPRESGIVLQVIPHVNEQKDIAVTLKPTVGGPITFETINVTSGNDRVVMKASSRTAETQVMVNDGETVFIGGLIDETKTVQDNKLPFLGDMLGDVPGIGTLVKFKSDVVSRTEIVIFITVHLMKNPESTNAIGLTGFSGRRELTEDPKAENGLLLDELSDTPVAPAAEDKRKPLFDFRKKTK